MQTPQPTETASLVHRARRKLGLKQGEFAIRMGKSQAVVSRYEKGLVAPPGDIIMHCMHILGDAPVLEGERTDVREELVTILEAALTMARSMRNSASNLTQCDPKDDNVHPPG